MNDIRTVTGRQMLGLLQALERTVGDWCERHQYCGAVAGRYDLYSAVVEAAKAEMERAHSNVVPMRPRVVIDGDGPEAA